MNSVVPLLKFTPSAQEPEVLEAITVQRESLIAKLVDVALDTSGGARHQLLIGSRGMGKTHILTLVASRVRAQAAADSLTLAWLEEDPWGVGSYEKFLAAIVSQVAAERSDPELAAKADELHASRDDSGQTGEQVLRDAVGNARLVLLVENLDDVFRRIGENGQERFRALIENWQQVVVIATAPRLFEGVQRQTSPFYGFFAVTHLKELSLDSAADLMKRVAQLRGDEELVRFLGTPLAKRRLAAIEALAGGHPRIWLLLAGCVSIRAIDQLVPLFLQALDELTPYYQDRLRELGDQQQELIVLLSEAGGALSNRALSERSGIPQNQIATILRQLSGRGYVRRAEVSSGVATGDARMSFWELREPLMRLCLDVKQARGKPLRMVVEFLRAWYGPRLLDELVRLPEDASLAATYAGEAFRMLEGDLPTDELLRGSPEEIVSRAERGLDLKPERVDLRLAKATGLLQGGRDDEAREYLDELLEEDLAEGLAWSIRGLRELAEHGLDTARKSGFSVLDLVEKANFDSGGIAALVARSYNLLDRKHEALALFRNTAEAGLGDATVLRDYGILASQLRFHEEAVDALTQAVELRPESAAAHSNRSIALRHLGRLEEAVAEAREAIRLAPENAAAHDTLGNALAAVGEFEAAAAAGRTATELQPDNARMLSNLGAAVGRMGRDEEALEIFSRAAEIEPANPSIHANRALALVQLERLSEALAAIERSVALAPENPGFRLHLSQVLTLMNRHADAVRTLEEASAADPDNAETLRELGKALRRAGRRDEAVPVLRRAVELDPDSALALGQLAVSLGEIGETKESLELLERATDIDPDNAFLRRNQCAALTHLSRHAEALEAIEQAVVNRPKRAEYHEVRGLVLSNLGRYAEAVSAIEKAVELEPDNASFHERLAGLLSNEGRMEKALAEVERAVDLSPESHKARNLQADLLRELDRLDEAEATAAVAMELAPDEHVILFTATEIALARRNEEEALRRLRKALRIWSSNMAGPAGETDVLCRILWERYVDEPHRRELIEEIVRAYEEVDAVESLGAGLVESIPLFVPESVDQKRAEAWVEDWSASGSEQLEIPLNLLKAAQGWKEDRDRAHLLRLPLEQREVLSPLLGGES